MVETVVIMTVLMLFIFGIIQFALIYNAKTTLNYAAFVATRAGALNYANSQAIQYAFSNALSPLYASVDQADGMLDRVASVQTARDRINTEINRSAIGRGSACFEQLNPIGTAFDSHEIVDTEIIDQAGYRVIPNDHLKFRSTDPRGSNVSIQDANLLKIRVTYCYPLYVPFIANVIRRLKGIDPDPDPLPGWVAPTLGNFHSSCYRDNGMPIVAQAIVRMQTPVMRDNTYMGNTCL
jgi:hypothetical protein